MATAQNGGACTGLITRDRNDSTLVLMAGWVWLGGVGWRVSRQQDGWEFEVIERGGWPRLRGGKCPPNGRGMTASLFEFFGPTANNRLTDNGRSVRCHTIRLLLFCY